MIQDLITDPTLADAFVIFGWFGLIALMVLKKEWFFHFDERLPRFEVFDRLIYQGFQQVLFMGARFLFILLFAGIVSMIVRLFG